MFNNLVESDLHTQERARTGRFFLGTLAAYAVVLLLAGVASIYAYDAHLAEQTFEYEVTFVPPVETAVAQQPRRNEPLRAATNAGGRESIRTEFIRPVGDSTVAPDHTSAAPPRVPELPDGNVRLGDINLNAGSPGPLSGTIGGGPIGDGTRRTVVDIPDTPPPPRAVPTPTPPIKIHRVSSVLNGVAISLPKPLYPAAARAVKAYGTVAVQVLIDETGRVISAQAVSGHPLLRTAAAQAAQQARFSPTILGGQPVKVSGMITYNFIL
jgi:protein TonB